MNENCRYIHDEMYGVALDGAGNYLLLGGSGDEYPYSADNAQGWSSDVWVSYLVVVEPNVSFFFIFGPSVLILYTLLTLTNNTGLGSIFTGKCSFRRSIWSEGWKQCWRVPERGQNQWRGYDLY